MKHTFTVPMAFLLLGFFMATSSANAQGCDGTSCTVNTTEDESFLITDCIEATADGNGMSLREAVGCINTTSSNTINFALAVQGATFNLNNGALLASANLTVNGNNETINGINQNRVLELTGLDSTITAVTFTNGSAPAGEDGGCLLINQGTHILDSVTFTNCQGFSGGAIDINDGADLTVTNGSFNANIASRAGGAIEIAANSNSTLTLTNSTGTMNSANGLSGGPGNGGFLHITGGGGNATINGGSYTMNTASSEGGAFWNADGIMTLESTIINNNTASGDSADDGGGGVFNNGGTLNIDSNTMVMGNLANGVSGSGGGVFSLDGSLNILSGSVIDGNSANRAGGGVEIVDGTFTTSSSVRIQNNDVNGSAGTPNPGNGGGLHVTGIANLTLFNSIVSNNIAANEGGGLWNQNGSTMTVKATQIVNNASMGSGGAVDDGGGGLFNNGGEVILEDDPGPTTFVNNRAEGTVGSGGAILSVSGQVSGTAIFQGNTANRAGGAIEMNGGMLEINDSLFELNGTPVLGQTASPGNGGALHITGASAATFSSTSLSENFASREGGALWNSSTGSLTVDNSSLTLNIASGDAADDGGGGIFNDGGTLLITNNTQIDSNLANGTAGSGGGVFSINGTVTINNGAQINGNSANRAGGGIEVVAGILQMDNAFLNDNDVAGNAGNPAPGNGGGLHVTGPAKIDINQSIVDNNFAAREGGGLWNSQTAGMTISNSQVTNNVALGDSADDGGGGIFNNGGVTIITANTVLANNNANGTSGSGGGLLSTSGSVTINGSSLITQNSANRAGGGIEIIDGTLNIINAIISENDVNGGAGTPAPGNGGALHITGSTNTHISLSQILNNEAANEGGGLWNQTGSSMTLAGTLVEGNTAHGAGGTADDGGGGLFNNGGQLNLIFSGGIGNQVLNNNATGSLGSGGGLLSLNGEVVINGASFSNNAAIRAGGAIEMNGGTLTMVDTVLSNNNLPVSGQSANPGNGGALHVTGETTTTITGGSVSNNFAAREGGGLWNSAVGDMTVSGTIIDSNIASGNESHDGGGGLFNDGGTLTINGQTQIINNIANGLSGSGGGLLSVDGVITINDEVLFDSNSANRAGGAIELVVGELHMSQSTMINNDVNDLVAGASNPGNGGAVHISGNAYSSFYQTTISNNQAASEGGGLWNSATGIMQVNQTLLNGNITASNDVGVGHGGGGVFNNGGTLTLTNNTLSGNDSAALGGGALLVETQAPVLIEYNTIANNVADTGGGISAINNNGVIPTLSQNIVGNNVAINMTPDLDGELNSLGFNLISDTTGSTFSSSASDLLDTDPLLLPLADNGGFNASHMPDVSSPAIDNGNSDDCIEVDQRNFVRTVGTCDIGSIEVGSFEGLDIIFENGFEIIN